MPSLMQPHAHIALRLPSESLKVVELVPNSTISIGKFGSFPSNLLLGRPYHLTFEIIDREEGKAHSNLRIVPTSELHSDILAEASSGANYISEGREIIDGGDGVEYELVGENGEVLMRSNREIIDDPSRQKLTMEEIELLKKEGAGGGKDIIALLMQSHTALDQKTAFSLAKYTLRKAKKYVKRFTVLPVDIPLLAHYLLSEKEAIRTMELRGESLALMGSWANIHYGGDSSTHSAESLAGRVGVGRWLVVDDTGGLVIAALAERMGILYPAEGDGETNASLLSLSQDTSTEPAKEANGELASQDSPSSSQPAHCNRSLAMSATSNTLTLIHANAQPNLSLLKYFHYDTSVRDTNSSHPFHTHLKTISWLQLLSPHEDTGYAETEVVPNEVLQTWKGGKRGTYFKKRRRWERIKSVVDETRAGGFDGLVVASAMNPVTIFQHTIPLLRGAAQVVVYSPHIEPLTELADLYSIPRRTAFATDPPASVPCEDFPLNPTLLLAPAIHTVKAKPWQCLPGRTHPIMTGKGGAEGYIFHATRVFPAEGKVEARGKHKRRKVLKEQGDNGIVGSGNETPGVGFEPILVMEDL
ncbi:MAG: tRNA (adenine(58)-N(1))-methyltransferase non-catalytic subunit trm6 [Geoglossum simile]|nr:MAG: tRNA (adenine(58)-N(1))-methyltransferase non-catalytic subunit trm6 [Geoglossum simile]